MRAKEIFSMMVSKWPSGLFWTKLGNFPIRIKVRKALVGGEFGGLVAFQGNPLGFSEGLVPRGQN